MKEKNTAFRLWIALLVLILLCGITLVAVGLIVGRSDFLLPLSQKMAAAWKITT